MPRGNIRGEEGFCLNLANRFLAEGSRVIRHYLGKVEVMEPD